jgi:hypothetical protein
MAQPSPADGRPQKGAGRRGQPDVQRCTICGIKLSSYNPGPNCWQHTIGYPWRGPSAKPKY